MGAFVPGAGYYGVVQTRGLAAWVIRRATRSWANHAFVLVDDFGELVEAQPGGVRRGHISQYAGCRIAFNTGERATRQQLLAVACAAESMLGTAYNDLGIADLGLESLGWHWRWLASLAQGDHELICSQLVAQAGHAAGLDYSCGKQDLAEVTPGDLARRPGVYAQPI